MSHLHAVTVRRFFVGAIAIACALVAPRARAGPCCSSAFGIGDRLLPWERLSLTMSGGATAFLGRWDGTSWRTNAPQTTDVESRQLGLAMIRIAPRLQLWAQGGFQANWEGAAGAPSSRGIGVSDVAIGSRVDVVPVGGSAWPGVALTLAVVAPTGRGPEAARDPLFADVTGLGTWEVRPGLVVELPRGDAFVRAAVSYGVRAGFTRRDARQVSPAGDLALALSGGYDFGAFAVALTLRVEQSFASKLEGRRLEGGDVRRTTLLPSGSVPVANRVRIVAYAEIDPPVDGFGENGPGGVGGYLGVRVAFE